VYFPCKRKGYGRKAVPFLFIFICIFSASRLSAGQPADVPAIIRKADSLQIADDPYWRTLLHYKPAGFGRYTSLIDDPAFFLAKNGKHDPHAELIATIQAFFSPYTEGRQHPTAKFPARYAWLRKKLSLDTSLFPYDGDKDYLVLKTKINPGRIYLVFPAGYMKNPASMFGHTFLLIETKDKPRLLAYSVNYGAVTPKIVPAPVYAFNGLVGAYKGYYSFIPYYQKIREYGDIDMRDMWEYRLSFTPEEKDRLLRHIVEMSGIYSDYYFISENCSYNLLFLLEAAQPETKLTDRLKTIVEPIETVKLVKQLGIAGEWTYRPSLYTRIEYWKTLLPLKENRYVKQVCLGKTTVQEFPFTGTAPEKQAVLWDLAADYLKFLLTEGTISAADYRSRIISILSARKNLGKIPDKEPPEPAPPHKAHGSSNIAFGAGKTDKGFYADTGYRLTAHEMMDTDPGYTKNSQIAFCRINVRYRFADETFSLRSADLADIISLPVSDTYFFNKGFTFRTGLETTTGKSNKEQLAWRVKYEYGLSVAPATWSQLYIFGGADVFFSPAYDYGTDPLVGGELGLITTAGVWKGKLSAALQQSPLDLSHTRYSLNAEERIALSQNCAAIGSYSFKGDYGEYSQEGGVSFRFYFR
jgi:hypothetical protein